MSKVAIVEEAVAGIRDGAVLMVGGFMGVGTPPAVIDEIVRLGVCNLVVVTNDTARPGVGVGKLIDAKLVARLITSHIGTNPETQRQMIAGELQVELVPQGTLAERIRAGGFGLGGVVTPTGVGTIAAEGKRIITVDGRDFLLELPIKADIALIKAKRADYAGNLEYALTARNFNPLMAMAAETVVAEVEEIVPTGTIPPDAVATPHVLVDRIVMSN
jgi:acetate CoA/acetoacetate CoA-transferase alpha subunit